MLARFYRQQARLAYPRKPHKEQEQSHRYEESSNVIKVLDELHFVTRTVLHAERRRTVEQVPGECGSGIEGDEEVVDTVVNRR
jgi:hypothetical protein